MHILSKVHTYLFPCCAVALVIAAGAQAQTTGASVVLPAVTVTAPVDLESQPTNAASEQRISGETLNARPVTRPAEILEAVPGLIVTQHSGEGKANQYFLRGFNLDHGTDIGIWLDGMPINMRTHAHGRAIRISTS
jgi:outer membrane receptor for Fe3+-dicitrate